jgi:hypothetical protein
LILALAAGNIPHSFPVDRPVSYRIITFIIYEKHVGFGMDHRRPIIRSIVEAEDMHSRLLKGAAATAAWLRAFSGEPMALLKALRFELVGHDPLTGEPLNEVDPGYGTSR